MIAIYHCGEDALQVRGEFESGGEHAWQKLHLADALSLLSSKGTFVLFLF